MCLLNPLLSCPIQSFNSTLPAPRPFLGYHNGGEMPLGLDERAAEVALDTPLPLARMTCARMRGTHANPTPTDIFRPPAHVLSVVRLF